MTARDLAHTLIGVLGLWLVVSQIPVVFVVVGSPEPDVLLANWIAQAVASAAVGTALFLARVPLGRLIAPASPETVAVQDIQTSAIAVIGAYLLAVGVSEFIPGVFVYGSSLICGEGLTKALFGLAFFLLAPRLARVGRW